MKNKKNTYDCKCLARRFSSYLLCFLIPLSLNAVELTGKARVNDEVAGYLQEILLDSGNNSLTISRGSASPADQARVMYDYALRAGAKNCISGRVLRQHTCECKRFEQRRACSKAGYGSIGDSAMDAITDGDNRAQAIAEMTVVISQLIAKMGSTRNQMAHVPIKGRYAVDIDPASVPDKAAFKRAVMRHRAIIQERFFYPGKVGGPPESAFHIEFLLLRN